jgi:hypothetical protein
MVRPLALATLVAAAACSFPEQPLPPGARQVVVHAILDPSLRYQLIHLELTDGAEMHPGDLDAATVSIIAPDGTTLTAKQDTGVSEPSQQAVALPDYRIDLQAAGFSLVPGSTYQLHIVTRLGEVITGKTTIPSATPVGMPSPVEFHRLLDTVRLSWPRVSGARAYQVQVWSTESYDSQGLYKFTRLRYTAFVDTSFTMAGAARTWDDSEVFPFVGTARIYVYAVDDSYYEYYRQLGDPFIGAAPSRLQGGLGIFGSIVPVAQQQLTLKLPQR